VQLFEVFGSAVVAMVTYSQSVRLWLHAESLSSCETAALCGSSWERLGENCIFQCCGVRIWDGLLRQTLLRTKRLKTS